MKYIVVVALIFFAHYLIAQEDLPYREIPEYSSEFTPETVAARMVDGLGFRYYWATDGLREEDLSYKPNEDARTARETLEHIHGLANFLLCTTQEKVQSSVDVADYSFEELRKATLLKIEEASTILKSGEVQLSELIIEFENSNTTYPFWNQINGPISDALWHVGQIVSFRRSSGNPFTSNVSVFTGKVKN